MHQISDISIPIIDLSPLFAKIRKLLKSSIQRHLKEKKYKTLIPNLLWLATSYWDISISDIIFSNTSIPACNPAFLLVLILIHFQPMFSGGIEVEHVLKICVNQ